MSNSNNEPGPKNREGRLHPISRSGQTCEMGDEDNCPFPATHVLDDPATYHKPLRCCQAHANDEVFYRHIRIYYHPFRP